jgi:hypothetical protein
MLKANSVDCQLINIMVFKFGNRVALMQEKKHGHAVLYGITVYGTSASWHAGHWFLKPRMAASITSK